jgi:aminoacyl tRNA synthase complex-interacting multifunctional protein 1
VKLHKWLFSVEISTSYSSDHEIYMQDRNVVVLANLKPRNMRGVKSCGMLMAASDASHENVELLVPPEGSLTGERVWFGSEDEEESQPAAATPNQVTVF